MLARLAERLKRRVKRDQPEHADALTEMLCQTLVLALLFSLSILFHILSCTLYNNWLHLMLIAYASHQHRCAATFGTEETACLTQATRLSCTGASSSLASW